MAVPDTQLEQWVSHELHYDPKIDADAIAVSAHDGAITLRGTVGRFSEKRNAQKDALRVAGVKSVDNELEVRVLTSHGRADADLRGDVLRALQLNSLVPDTVDARVDDGWVTLLGTARSEDERREAEYVAGNVPEVLGLSNDIELESPENGGDAKQSIRKALARHAKIHDEKLAVETYQGTASLSGTVGSWGEYDEVLRIAYTAPGISKVDDHIVVDV
jgi:osmotically-inducible protein OsmY